MQVLLLLLGAACASAWPSPDKFKASITACKGLSALANCTAVTKGVCETDSENGQRSCGCGHHWHHGHHELPNFMGQIGKLLDNKQGMHFPRGRQLSMSSVHAEVCANKKDGEVCSMQKEGQCIPSGKCPMFHGEMVCHDNNAHAPKFVTDPCKDKQVGDECTSMYMPGKCEKPVYLNDMFCKVQWHGFSGHLGHAKSEEVVVV